MNEKKRWPWAEAMATAEFLILLLEPHCERIAIAGSLRREKEQVGDVEILFIPRYEKREVPDGLFMAITNVNLADEALEQMLADKLISTRLNKLGGKSWGEKNKFAVLGGTQGGMPIDFFVATRGNWWNYFVCRTGGMENNILISNAAIERGMKWHPYGEGFTCRNRGQIAVQSEEHLYELVGLPYLTPRERK